MIELDKIYYEDCLKGLKHLGDCTVDCVVTSPPYYALRDYGVDGQVGLEDSPKKYIRKLVKIFREVLRVMKPMGTCWVVIGDSYAGSNKGAAAYPENAKLYKQGTNKGTMSPGIRIKYKTEAKERDLIGIPWMLAFALRDLGFYLRQDIIWHKPNPMPESCTSFITVFLAISRMKRSAIGLTAAPEYPETTFLPDTSPPMVTDFIVLMADMPSAPAR